MKRIVLEPAYVLHRRSYRETSVLIELFTPNHGRFSVIANGVRKQKSTTQGILQPFTPLIVSCSGNGELLRLNSVEMNAEIFRLSGECLYAGLYLNELLVYLLEKWDAHPALYQIYAKTLTELNVPVLQPQTLRQFEKSLLQEIGYGLLPLSESSFHSSINSDNYYRFVPEQGFEVCSDAAASFANVFLGKQLLAIMMDDWHLEGVLADAKRLMRLVLTPLLGGKSIQSRKLFM